MLNLTYVSATINKICKKERVTMSKVTFDYSKASSFIREDEVESMKMSLIHN